MEGLSGDFISTNVLPGERLGLEGELRTMALDLYLKEGMLLRVLLVYLVLLPSL